MNSHSPVCHSSVFQTNLTYLLPVMTQLAAVLIVLCKVDKSSCSNAEFEALKAVDCEQLV